MLSELRPLSSLLLHSCPLCIHLFQYSHANALSGGNFKPVLGSCLVKLQQELGSQRPALEKQQFQVVCQVSPGWVQLELKAEPTGRRQLAAAAAGARSRLQQVSEVTSV